jgi:hypothetical protein
MPLDGQKKRFMVNMNIAIFDYSMDGDKHIFSYKDSSYLDNIEGTIPEIAYLIFEKCVVGENRLPNDTIHLWPPFEVETTALGQSIVKTDCLCNILPEPDQSFWDDLNKHFQRYLGLKAFW